MAPLCFVVGAPRSGTTLLRVMMAGHPRLFSPPEMIIAPFATMADRRRRLTERFWEKGGLRRAILELEGCDVDAAKAIEASLDESTVPDVYAWLRDRLGERILVDKCPHLAADPAALERLGRWYPDAKWVWIVRHPGSVTRSVENMPMAEVMLQGYAGDPRDIWFTCNDNLKRFLATVPAANQTAVRYEDLVTAAARPALQRVCDVLGLPWDDALLTPYEGDRMREGPPGARAVGDPNMAGRGKIEPELATKWLASFDPASVGPSTHALARELGYDLGAMAAPPLAQVTESLRGLLDSVARLEREMRVPADLDAVEGRRFLLRQMSHAIELFVEHGDADHPAFHHAEGPIRKQFADCPDTDYLRSALNTSGSRSYRVWGRVASGFTYVGILLYRRGGQIGNRLSDTAFVRSDGTFDVTISVAPAASGTWLRADGDETGVIVRQYYTDRGLEAPIEVKIALAGGTAAAEPLDASALAKQLERARRGVEATFERTLGAWKMASVGALNRFISIGGEQLFPTPDNSYLVCWYRLGPDQAMRIRGTRLPRARYVAFTLYNMWMESLDYERRIVTRNSSRITTATDGSYEILLGHRDLGHPNGLDTAGHLAGYVIIRALLAEEDVPVPVVEVLYERELG